MHAALRRIADELFLPVIRSAEGRPPALTELRLRDYVHRARRVECYLSDLIIEARFDNGMRRCTSMSEALYYELSRAVPVRQALFDFVNRDGPRYYSEWVEDHIIDTEIRSARRQLIELHRSGAISHATFAEGIDVLRRREAHAQAFHNTHADRFERERDSARMRNFEVARYTEADYEIRPVPHRQRMLSTDMPPHEVSDFLSSLFSGSSVLPPAGAAEKRAWELLRSRLSPKQLETLDAYKHFEVTGGETGHVYRIKKGRQMNIYELKKDGTPKCGWCFLPSGNLAEGDVMLAQKYALETNETAALKIANRFVPNELSGGWVAYDVRSFLHDDDRLDASHSFTNLWR